MHLRKLATLGLAFLASSCFSQSLPTSVKAPSHFGGLNYRLIGPFRGGRALAVAGVPGQPEKFYFGAVGGGVWETENAGRTWTPIFDDQPIASIGAIAVAPSDPNVIYVGTGEADMRSDIQQGIGMYVSRDAGKTWEHIGLEDTRQIGKILVDPNNANIVYVAALGHQYGPNEERGVFRSTDGGRSWLKVLYRSPDVGAIDLAMDPANTNVIYASMWQTRRPPWNTYPPSNGPGGGLFKSVDGGATWSQLTGGGFPAFVGRIGIAVSPASHNRVYAFVDTNNPKDGGIYRSDDGGANWKYTDGEQRVWIRGWYFAGITADPKDPNTVYVMSTSTYRSTDAGKSFIPIKGAPGGDDYHTMWIEPNDPKRMILGSDQGVVISVDGAKTWSSWYNQPTGQFYHVSADNRFPYWVYGSQQDSGSMAGPSRSIHTGLSSMDWRPINAGGESNMIAPDPLHPGTIFGEVASKEQLDTGWIQGVDPTMANPIADEGDPATMVWRSTWTLPTIFSQADPHVLYTAHQKIFRSDDGGSSWKVISPDLTRGKNDVPETLDPATIEDNIGLPRRGVVYSLAPSPIQKGEIWAGTDDGLIWLTRDEGAHWENVTPKELTPWSKVGILDASHFDKDTAYAAVDRHRLDDNHPYIYRTHDGGKHWELCALGLPTDQFVNVVRKDPYRKGLLYAGTDRGVYVSFDEGNSWQSLQLNLPAASIRDIVFQDHDMIIATHGRALWILDDPAPLRQSNQWLCKPTDTILVQGAAGFGGGTSDEGTPFPPEEPQGKNPPRGAYLYYDLQSDARLVEFTVTDSGGKLIRKISSADKPRHTDLSTLDIPAYWVHDELPLPTGKGGHRLVWNLHYLSDGGPSVPPGMYKVAMSVDGTQVAEVPLKVSRDPRIAATDEDLREQFTFGFTVRAEIESLQKVMTDAQAWMRKEGVTEAQRAQMQELIGGRRGRRRRAGGTPDMGTNEVEDSLSLGSIMGKLGGLEGAVSGAPSAPTKDYRKALTVLKGYADADVAKIRALMKS
ncbi:MAG TPA: hypothetical protein VGL56_14710 [Fimbriimonadaceae bacterium]|jgi:photosystem II stability/assembly factor-like uncharacterized protein